MLDIFYVTKSVLGSLFTSSLMEILFSLTTFRFLSDTGLKGGLKTRRWHTTVVFIPDM